MPKPIVLTHPPTKVFMKDLHRIFEQFAIMDTIIPHYPRYAYVNAILDNHYGIRSSRVANEVLDLWKDINYNIKKNASWTKSKN